MNVKGMMPACALFVAVPAHAQSSAVVGVLNSVVVCRQWENLALGRLRGAVITRSLVAQRFT